MSRAFLIGHVAGEVQAADIPLSAAVTEAQLQALLEGDADPMQVVIEVGPGKSSRGWHYTEGALQKLVTHVEHHSLAGIMGHQRDEDMSTEFRAPVTHWVGAKWDGGKAYFRGVIDKTAPDLKRWIKAGRVTQPSIFTRPTVATNSRGEQEVTDLEPLSIDWAPLDRAGMQTARVVAWGELADGESDPPPPPQPTPTPRRGRRTTPEPQEGHMERSELVAAVAALHDAPSFASDVAAHDQGWRELQASARVAGELATHTNQPLADLPAYMNRIEAERQASLSTIDGLATLVGKPAGELKAAVEALMTERNDLRTRFQTLRLTTLRPRIDAVAGEMIPGPALQMVFADELAEFVRDRDVDTDENLKAAAGELKATDRWKGRLEKATTGGQHINPPPPRTSQNGGTSGPDMSVFGTAFTSISAT